MVVFPAFMLAHIIAREFEFNAIKKEVTFLPASSIWSRRSGVVPQKKEKKSFLRHE
jgi:hypothetical protein